MKFSNVAVASISHVDAPEIISSQAIENGFSQTIKRLNLPSLLLESLSGIANRRFWGRDMLISDAATIAANKALSMTTIDRRHIGALINTSVCRDYLEPSTASIIHHKLDLGSHCINFDLSNACLGFLNGMDIIGNWIEHKQIDYGLIVNAQSSRSIVEKTISRLADSNADLQCLRDNFTTLTLGSGAAAMVLARADLVSADHRFTGSVGCAATQHNHLCCANDDGMKTDSPALLTAGTALAEDTWKLANSELGWTQQCFNEIVLHQVSTVHTNQITKVLGLDLSKILSIYPEFGNIGPAALPIALSKSLDAGRIKSGSRVALMGIGSGMNCSMGEILW